MKLQPKLGLGAKSRFKTNDRVKAIKNLKSTESTIRNYLESANKIQEVDDENSNEKTVTSDSDDSEDSKTDDDKDSESNQNEAETVLMSDN